MDKMQALPGVFQAQKKNGEIYYRSSITYKNKHISLGSFPDKNSAHYAYLEAQEALLNDSSHNIDSFSEFRTLPFDKWIVLLNFRDNGIYIKNPIYLRKTYFEYYFSQTEMYLFDIDDLFYYSEHKIMKRGEHLFVSDYGMQVSILSRYGIRNHSAAGKDYIFKNGSSHDLRYENIQVINPYNGVRQISRRGNTLYQARIHIKGNYVVGTYQTADEAAIAYNKAIDHLKKAGSKKNYQPNFLEHLTSRQYADIYSKISISGNLPMQILP